MMVLFAGLNTLILCGSMIGFGLLFLKHPPKSINAVFGYRTRRSMENQETWDFAHRYAGKVWLWSGWITLVLSVAAILCFHASAWFETVSVVLVVGQLIALLLVLPITERKLHQKKR